MGKKTRAGRLRLRRDSSAYNADTAIEDQEKLQTEARQRPEDKMANI